MSAPQQILCLSRDVFNGYRVGPGFHPAASPRHPDVQGMLQRSIWLARSESLEDDPGWLQWIAYGILAHEGQVFRYRRPRRSGDPRLRDLMSLGVGGHVEPGDNIPPGVGLADPAVLGGAMARELDEEVRPLETLLIDYCGLLYDPTDPIGRVHLGAVFCCRVASQDIDPGRAEIRDGSWEAPESLATGYPDWESWSRVLLAHLPRILAGPT